MRIFSKVGAASFILLTLALLVPSSAFAQADEPWKGAYTTPAFANGAIRDVYCDLVGEVEGSYGALTFVVGGIMAFGYAVFGDTKKGYSIIMAGIVGATMSTGISLSFGKMCGDTNTARTTKSITSADTDFSNAPESSQIYLESDDELF